MLIDSFLESRQYILDVCKSRAFDLLKYEELKSPRGLCRVFDDCTIADTVRPNWHLSNRDLEDAEFNLIYHSIDMSKEWHDKLYGDDEKLYQDYKSLNIQSLLTNGKRRTSRKNIIFNSNCCLCYWQLHRNKLYVVCRSMDLQRAGKSDLVLVNRIAQALDCSEFQLHITLPHVYDDMTKIARRQD